MKKIIDFDKMFEKFLISWFKDNAKNYESIDKMEEDAPNIYLKWMDTINLELGVKPKDYFLDLTAKELVECLKEYIDKNIPVSDILCDTIVDNKDSEKALFDAIKESNNNEFILLCCNMLNELQSTLPFDLYIEWITKEADQELQEIAVEILTEYASSVKEKLLGKINEANDEVKRSIADILYREKDEKIYDLLVELFKKDIDTALYAAYLGKHGNEKALDILITKIKSQDINYVEFLELKNAIESLGGDTTEFERNFEEDNYYKALKGIK